MAYAALQWQGTGTKNQLVLGRNGTQAVISAENFGQISTIKIPDPGVAKSSFVLTDSKSGAQSINGNLNVSGTLTGGELTVTDVTVDTLTVKDLTVTGTSTFGNLTAAAGDIEALTVKDLTVTGTSAFGNLTVDDLTVNNTITATAGDFGTVSAEVITASTSAKVEGDLTMAGNILFDNGADRQISFDAAKSAADAVKLSLLGNDSNGGAGGSLVIKSGAATSGDKTGGLLQITGGAGSGNGQGGQVEVTAGVTASGEGGKTKVTGGASSAVGPGGEVDVTGGAAAAGIGGKVVITGGASSSAGAGGEVSVTGGASANTAGGNVSLQVGTGGAGINGAIRIGNTTLPSSILIGSSSMTGTTSIFAFRQQIANTSGGTVSIGQSGGLLRFTKPGGFTIVLPTTNLAAGLNYEFVLDSVGDGTVVDIDAGANGMLGNWIACPSAVGAATGQSTGGTAVRYLQFTANSVRGDRARFVLGLTTNSWFVTAFTGAANGMAFAP